MNRLTRMQQAPPKIRFAGKVSVVPRAACRLERVWMPARTREGMDAARLAVGRNLLREGEFVFVEPPPDTGAGYVNTWICSPEAVSGNRVWIPEGILRAPGTSGARLVQCSEGYEGQIWDKGVLIATRWWVIPPGAADWRQFADGADAAYGLPDTDADWRRVPDVEMVPWRTDLSLLSLGRESIARVFTPARLAVAGLLLLALPFGFQAGSYVRLSLFMSDAGVKIAELEERNRSISASQRQARSDTEFATAMARAGDPMMLADALSDLRTALGEQPATVTFIDLAGAGVEIRLKDYPDTDIPELVARLDATGRWSATSASMNRAGELVVKGQLNSERKG